eukprot:GAHX01000065.1.p1 GENE.GAHX01000065.1~~GAHX01000065.1.p1  ORF type:complete len:115 (+),score=34.26 GAHX01000065.1:43-345(+)
MNSVAAFLFLCNSGKASPEASDMKKLMGAIDVEYDESTMRILSDAIAEKSFEDVIQEGKSKCGSVSASSGASAAESKTEEAKEEAPAEESDEELDMDLFD